MVICIAPDFLFKFIWPWCARLVTHAVRLILKKPMHQFQRNVKRMHSAVEEKDEQIEELKKAAEIAVGEFARMKEEMSVCIKNHPN